MHDLLGGRILLTVTLVLAKHRIILDNPSVYPIEEDGTIDPEESFPYVGVSGLILWKVLETCSYSWKVLCMYDKEKSMKSTFKILSSLRTQMVQWKLPLKICPHEYANEYIPAIFFCSNFNWSSSLCSSQNQWLYQVLLAELGSAGWRLRMKLQRCYKNGTVLRTKHSLWLCWETLLDFTN